MLRMSIADFKSDASRPVSRIPCRGVRLVGAPRSGTILRLAEMLGQVMVDHSIFSPIDRPPALGHLFVEQPCP